jgi:hypothetical protein
MMSPHDQRGIERAKSRRARRALRRELKRLQGHWYREGLLNPNPPPLKKPMRITVTGGDGRPVAHKVYAWPSVTLS